MITQVIDVTFVAEFDPGYRAHGYRWAAQRPIFRGLRAAGEMVGRQVECAARHWIGKQVSLRPERILRWRQRSRSGRYEARYREVDAVYAAADASLCLYEIKLTTVARMQRGEGLAQLRESVDLLSCDPQHPRICRRLVYIAEQQCVVKGGLPAVDFADLITDVGVIWITPAAIETAARELEIRLPENWIEPATRTGSLLPPEEDWRQHLGEDTALSCSLAGAFKQAFQNC